MHNGMDEDNSAGSGNVNPRNEEAPERGNDVDTSGEPPQSEEIVEPALEVQPEWLNYHAGDIESSYDSDSSDDLLSNRPRMERLCENSRPVIIPPGRSIPLLLNNPHIMLQDRSINDLEVSRILLQRLMLIIHSRHCLNIRRESVNGSPPQCNHRYCDLMCSCLAHLENCNNYNCKEEDLCLVTRVILEHWENCTEKRKCNLCGTFLYAMRRI